MRRRRAFTRRRRPLGLGPALYIAPALYKSVIFISSCDSHLSAASASRGWASCPFFTVPRSRFGSPDSGRPSPIQPAGTGPPKLSIGCRRLGHAAGEHGRGARTRAGPRPGGSAGGGLAQPSQDRDGLHGRYHRTAAPRPLCGAAAATPPPQRPARRAQGRPLSSTGAPGAAPTPKRACGGALVPTQHRPLTAPSSAASNA